MATTALVGGGIAAASAAGAAAAYIRALKTNAKPRQVVYGGSQDAQDALKQQYATGIDQGNQGYTQGLTGLGAASSAANGLTQQGQAITAGAGSQPSTYTGSQGSWLLGSYQPGQVAQAQSQATLDQNAQMQLGAARSGGALGLRNALMANAQSGVQAAQNAAIERGQEQQQKVAMQVAQANNDQQTKMQAAQFGQQQMLQQQQMGLSAQGQGIGLAANAAGNIGQLGLANQSQYLNQQQNVYDSQNQNNLAYEQQRQQNAQQKRGLLANFGSGLLGMGSMGLSMMGGKGG